MERYIFGLWLYAVAVGCSPLLYTRCSSTSGCNFQTLVPAPEQLWLFCAVYGPCAVIVLVCYAYIYVVARGHARAIYTVEASLRQAGHDPVHSRYGHTLAITVGLFLGLWLPFQVTIHSYKYSFLSSFNADMCPETY